MIARRYVLALDKESGPTSFSYIPRLRRIFQTKRIGHAGTLDPFASGLMLYAIGPACSALRFMEVLDKSYQLTAVFGQSRDSFDREGEQVEVLSSEELDLRLSRVDWTQALAELTGKVQQTVPIYSAVKLGGQPLYKYARKGQEVDLPERLVEIELLSRTDLYSRSEGPAMDFDLRVSKGTYIRSFVDDLGKKTGLLAYCQDLRRTRVGDLEIEAAVGFEDLQEFVQTNIGPKSQPEEILTELAQAGYLLSLEDIFKHQPRYELTQDEAQNLLCGRPLPLSEQTGVLALTYQGVILGFAEARRDQRMKSLRVFYRADELM